MASVYVVLCSVYDSDAHVLGVYTDNAVALRRAHTAAQSERDEPPWIEIVQGHKWTRCKGEFIIVAARQLDARVS